MAGQAQKASVTTPKSVPQLPRNLRAVRNGNTYKQENRTIIICLDGTGDKFDDDNSNIVHLVSCLKKSDPTQVTYYQSGIGTYDGGGLSNGFNAALDMSVGSGLGVHIRDAYRFLMQNYSQGDKICLFGFSRGAYTARCLAGMVHKVGLLPAHNVAQVPFAYQYYKDDSTKGWNMSEDFKKTFCIDVSIYFVGVFDSVASVGFIPRKLPLSATPKNKASYFRHAMALDERRAKFKACRFRQKSQIGVDSWDVLAEKEMNLNDGFSSQANGSITHANDANSRDTRGMKSSSKAANMSAARPNQTDVLEVWFAGCHADVGGGAVKNGERHKLSQVPLRWMIRQCFQCNTGIIFKTHRLAEEGLDIQTLFPVYTPLTRPVEDAPKNLRQRFENGNLRPITDRSTVLSPVDLDTEQQDLYYLKIYEDDKRQALAEAWVPEQAEDYFDAVQPINDQLAVAKTWWILELWPVKVRIQPPDTDTWIKKVRMNLGRYRPVQEKSPNLHWTVEERMRSLGYRVNARLERNAAWQVVT